MNTRPSIPRRVLVALPLLAALAACGHSTVVRTGPRHDTRTARPPSPPKAGATAVVRSGETLYRIATRYGLSPLDLAMWNRIPPPYTIYPGQRLRLTPPVAGRPSSSGAPPVARTPVPPRTSAGTSATPPPVRNPVPTPAPAAAPAQAPFAWRWPADGALVGSFAAGDPTRQGIDIGGRVGDPVRAAADGVVVYSGTGLVGYGELVIVKHDDQWLSAYGHNRARLVNEGQRVKAGDQIAEMGHSGASRDMLHFEIRYNGKPQDPLQALPKR